MKAKDELSEDQARQMLHVFDLEQAYNAFNGYGFDKTRMRIGGWRMRG